MSYVNGKAVPCRTPTEHASNTTVPVLRGVDRYIATTSLGCIDGVACPQSITTPPSPLPFSGTHHHTVVKRVSPKEFVG